MTQQYSQNGYPVLATNSAKLHDWVIPFKDGRSITLKLRHGSCGLIQAHYIKWYHERVESILHETRDYWGYSHRRIAGSTEWSDHASGTANDLLATKYPWGTRHMTDKKKHQIRRRLRFYRGTLYHGAFFVSRADEMHSGINAPIFQCERVARWLIKFGRGKAIIKANPGQREVIWS